MRTAIALMGFGVVIVRLRYLLPPEQHSHSYGWQLGLLFSLVGLLCVLLSTFHYFAVQRAIDADTYEPSGRWVILFSLAITLIGAGVLYYLMSAPVSAATAGAIHSLQRQPDADRQEHTKVYPEDIKRRDCPWTADRIAV